MPCIAFLIQEHKLTLLRRIISQATSHGTLCNSGDYGNTVVFHRVGISWPDPPWNEVLSLLIISVETISVPFTVVFPASVPILCLLEMKIIQRCIFTSTVSLLLQYEVCVWIQLHTQLLLVSQCLARTAAYRGGPNDTPTAELEQLLFPAIREGFKAFGPHPWGACVMLHREVETTMEIWRNCSLPMTGHNTPLSCTSLVHQRLTVLLPIYR